MSTGDRLTESYNQYGTNAWRLQLASAFIPTVPLLILVYLCPESPAWYIKSAGRYDLAFRSLCRLRNTELQASKELYYAYIQQPAKGKSPQSEASFAGKIIELFTISRNRRATIASCVVMLSQQLCGSTFSLHQHLDVDADRQRFEVNIIAFYSSTVSLIRPPYLGRCFTE
jgi:hypothetical protein